MQIISYGVLVLVLGGIGFLLWQVLGRRKQPLVNREFGYLRWVISLLNLFVFGLGAGLIILIIISFTSWLGGEWLTNLSQDVSVGFSIDSSPKSLLGTGVILLNTSASLGVLVCMRAFMKNILADQIFVVGNVRLARLSTLFFILGSLVREGMDSSGLIMHGHYASGSDQVSYAYSFFSMNYLLAAVLVWTLSIILEKAIAIADENEFTI